jgi:14-3-3 protein epsilon
MQSGHQLTSLERNLLSVGYKNTVASRRAAWRTLSDIQETEDFKKSKGDDKNGDQLVKWYKEKIQDELQNYCNEILDLLTGPEGLIAKQQGKEAAVFFKKMKGDYYRYLCEIHTA